MRRDRPWIPGGVAGIGAIEQRQVVMAIIDSECNRQYIDFVQRDLITGVMQLANLLTRRLGPVFGKSRITLQQWTVLSTLSAEGASTLAGLARSVLVSKQNMTGMVSRLEQLDLIERSDDLDDLRSSRVTLTRKGRSVIEKFRPAYDRWLRELGREVGEKELQSAERTVHTLIAELSADHFARNAESRPRSGVGDGRPEIRR